MSVLKDDGGCSDNNGDGLDGIVCVGGGESSPWVWGVGVGWGSPAAAIASS